MKTMRYIKVCVFVPTVAGSHCMVINTSDFMKFEFSKYQSIKLWRMNRNDMSGRLTS